MTSPARGSEEGQRLQRLRICCQDQRQDKARAERRAPQRDGRAQCGLRSFQRALRASPVGWWGQNSERWRGERGWGGWRPACAGSGQLCRSLCPLSLKPRVSLLVLGHWCRCRSCVLAKTDAHRKHTHSVGCRALRKNTAMHGATVFRWSGKDFLTKSSPTRGPGRE